MTLYTDKPFYKETCPYCGNPDCDANWVDVGVGHYAQCEPFHCLVCGASQIGPYDKERQLSDKEKETGWYSPDNPSDFISTINGTPLDTETALSLYRRRMVNQIPFRLTFSPEEEAMFINGTLSGYSIHMV